MALSELRLQILLRSLLSLVEWMVLHLSQSHNFSDMYQLTKFSDVDYTEALS